MYCLRHTGLAARTTKPKTSTPRKADMLGSWGTRTELMVYDVQVSSLRQPHDAPPSRTEETDRHSRQAPSKPAFQESESGNVQAVSWSPAQQKARQQQQQEQQQGEQQQQQQQQQPHQRRRGRHVSWPSMDSLADLNLPATAVQTVDRVAKEVVTVFGLAMKLLSYLGLGWKWGVQLSRLVLYAMLLMPGFLQMIIYYALSPRVTRSVPYGRKPRQRLDLYAPKNAGVDGALPVVIFVTGGAWTIGYKAWGALLGKRLCEHGVIVACLDYRNFPQGNALQMLEDVNTGIAWVCRKIERYGGDPERIYLVGQSAGGQLASLALLNQAAQAAAGEAVLGAAPVWHPLDIQGFVGVSGAYDLEGLAEHLHRRGLYKELLSTIMSIDGEEAYGSLSPLRAARAAGTGIGRFMPQVLLVHGTKDKSVPYESSVLMSEALQAANVQSRYQLHDGKTHTDFLLEDAMGGGRDYLSDSILSVITGREEVHMHPAMCPRFLVRLASMVCPF